MATHFKRVFGLFFIMYIDFGHFGHWLSIFVLQLINDQSTHPNPQKHHPKFYILYFQNFGREEEHLMKSQREGRE